MSVKGPPDYVQSAISVKDYAEVLQRIVGQVPRHLRGQAVPLAHLIIVERTIKDPIQKMRAQFMRRSLERRLGIG